MKQTFKLNKGEILFNGDKIIIKDDAKKRKWSSLLITGLGTLYFIETFLKSLKTGVQFDFWLGLIFILIGIPILTLLLLRSTKSEISLNEVKSMRIKQRFSNDFLDIKLVTNRIRRVSDISDTDELEKFIETNFDGK
jgi:hypothetical protein